MDRKTKKMLRRVAIAVPIVVLALYFIPWIALLLLLCGLIDVSRNKGKTRLMYQRYFMGNGIWTWLLSPFNLAIDLISHRNCGVLTLSDFPPEYRDEIERVLGAFRDNREAIIADIDRTFADGRRGMYVYRWYGKQHVRNIEAFNGDFRFLKTIAVSVFRGGESTSWHYGPLRLSYRVLYNLTPIDTDKVFIECNGQQHFWRDDPLYIFDDTLFHRSVNKHDAARYVVFMDIARPSYLPGVVEAGLRAVAWIADGMKGLFYKNWKLLGAGAKEA